MSYEFFSWKGFAVGGASIAAILAIQSVIGFPAIWNLRPLDFLLLVVASSLIVGVVSGGVLIYLIPPDQDVIGVAGLGSDNLSQHVSLLMVILALIQPMLSGFVFFYEHFGSDPVSFIWVLLGFAAPSLGFVTSMLERQKAIADDLTLYFSQHNTLDLASLDWLHGHGARTAVYRMGMLESAASKIRGLRVVGHEIVLDKTQFTITH
jgi:hypothetical protein